MIPSGYHELSLEKFIALTKSDAGILSTLEILTGIPKKTWSEVSFSNESIEALNISLAWSNKKCNWAKFPVPDEVQLGDKKIKVPARLDTKPFGMLVDFKERIVSKANAQTDTEVSVPPELMGVCIAICLHSDVEGTYNADTLQGTIDKVNQMPVTEAIPLFNFFLRKWWGFATVKVKSDTRKMSIVRDQQNDLVSLKT